MIINDLIDQYASIGWQLLHPLMYGEVLRAIAREAQVEVKEMNNMIYWRRNIDRKELELGL